MKKSDGQPVPARPAIIKLRAVQDQVLGQRDKVIVASAAKDGIDAGSVIKQSFPPGLDQVIARCAIDGKAGDPRKPDRGGAPAT